MKIVLLNDGRVVLEDHPVRFIFPSKESALRFHKEQLRMTEEDSYLKETIDRISAL